MSNNSEINLSTDAKIKYSNGIGKKDSKLYEMIKKETNDTFISWLKSNEDIKYFEYSNFRNLKPVGKGSYGSVLRANMKNAAGFYALKSFNNDETTLQQIINELDLYRTIGRHENILQLFGVTKIETDVVYQMSEYCLVLEYAHSGTLSTYLKKHFIELTWNNKLGLALQLTSAVSYLHDKNIIHCDLHANNILISKNGIKLADFGLSKKIAERSSNASKILGVIPYVDPKSFNNDNYLLSKKSDVYSVGVLLWQISSGREPFKDKGFDYDLRLVMSINDGLREKIIEGTPVEYSKLYTECWKNEPDERPDMQQVVSILKTMFENEENCSLENLINDSLISLNTSTNDENESFIIEFENDLIVNGQTVDELIEYIINKHDLGFAFDQIQQMLQLNKTTENLINWLLNNQYKAQYKWFLGLFYYYDIDTEDTEENSSKALKLFSRASEDNFSLAQIYLGKCYNDGEETEQSKYLAFTWYQKSVENGSILGQFYLGYCYEFGIGTKKNENKSVYWYQKAANNGNITAKLYLANCYRFGKGVKKDEVKAFNYYKSLARQKIADAQQQLGNYLYNGIGTEIDEVKALYWYKKAITNGNVIAKEIIKKYYNIKIKKNNLSLNYIILFFKSLHQLGLYFIGKILLMDTNFRKSFNYFQKAAEKENKFAQYILGDFYKNGNYVKKNIRKAFELYQKSAKQGYKYAQFQLGYYYDYGIGIDINRVKAFKLYKLAAEKGHNIAQNNLGMLYLRGEGTEKDLNTAVYWFQKAAKNDESYAQNNLGLCYELGLGINKDEIKAFEYYKKSAENGNINAKFQLGYCYVSGVGTEVNKIRGFELYDEAAGNNNNNIQVINNEKIDTYLDKINHWYKKAAENDSSALYDLGMCYEFGKGVYQNEIRAFEFYKKSADQGFNDAQCKLGYCYDHGIGVDINKEKAFEFYKLAAEKNNCEAQGSLALLYEQGEGTKKSIEAAIYWYKEAANNGCPEAKERLGILLKQGISQ
ncbi:kinase-like protein [Rhizophagus irregularis]|uniref:Kinase-like protein n=1 Tax=Rhizophagus irregularis TaxID=588596 RepID=A0A2N0SEM8_9GLOM|nr:kinase-like protein [Rhizophagus irregularis]